MNGYNDNEERALDEFLDETPAQPYPYPAPQEQFYGYPNGVPKRKKNSVIIALLCGILVIGIAILTFQIWGSLNNNDGQNTQNQPSYGQPFQNGEDTYGNGDGNDTYGAYGPDYNGGDDGGGEQFGQYQANDGTVIQFRIKGGKTEYSTDSGKTWSETPPEGMPPLP